VAVGVEVGQDLDPGDAAAQVAEEELALAMAVIGAALASVRVGQALQEPDVRVGGVGAEELEARLARAARADDWPPTNR
jgi:hypothetical protein